MELQAQQLFDAIQSADFRVIVSICLFAIVAYVKYVTEKGNVKGLALDVVSVLCSYAGGVAILLPAVDLPHWWFALIGALFNPTTSNGLRNLGVKFVKWLNKKFSKK